MRLSEVKIPCADAVSGCVSVPGSKSITNRALILSAMADGKSVLNNALVSVDTDVARSCLGRIGVTVDHQGTTFTVTANGGHFKPTQQPLYVHNAGTMARFLVPLLLGGTGEYVLDGNERMRKRPIGDLVEALRSIGCQIDYLENPLFPPLKIHAGGFPGGTLPIKGHASSQYVSALMLSAPLADRDVSIRIDGGLVSRTYVEMTAAVMRSFGIDVTCSASLDNISVKAGSKVKPTVYTIEADASSASYFFAMAAITGGRVTVSGISQHSLQGDLGMLGILASMGCLVEYGSDRITVTGGKLRGVDVNMNTMSDVAPTIAAVAVFAEGETNIRDVENMRIKECDRIHALCAELKKTGVEVTEHQDGLTIKGGTAETGAVFETYDDHRMAMALSLLGLRLPGTVILDPDCVSKTFPGYFDIFFDVLGSSGGV